MLRQNRFYYFNACFKKIIEKAALGTEDPIMYQSEIVYLANRPIREWHGLLIAGSNLLDR